MMISQHISYLESTQSKTALFNNIDNIPNERELLNMRLVANKVFEPLRNNFKTPIKINSFFRSVELNKAIGGSETSQHCKGQAIDIDDSYSHYTNKDFFYYIVENLEFDQIIWEFGNKINPSWVHFSYKVAGNRKKITISYLKNRVTKYKSFKTLEDFEKFKDKLYK